MILATLRSRQQSTVACNRSGKCAKSLRTAGHSLQYSVKKAADTNEEGNENDEKDNENDDDDTMRTREKSAS